MQIINYKTDLINSADQMNEQIEKQSPLLRRSKDHQTQTPKGVRREALLATVNFV